jgi:hypothetical protein
MTLEHIFQEIYISFSALKLVHEMAKHSWWQMSLWPHMIKISYPTTA